MSMDNDYELLSNLVIDSKRICLLSDKHSASEYKYAISQCAFFICTRTHASIAAYSTNVPTLVLGYSNKAIGIARDMGLEKFVLDISQLLDNDMLVERFEDLCHNYPKYFDIEKYIALIQDYETFLD
jgi:polysaccharide pyruvyl transferase WcaK-like protein